ncbi:hypothetical protein TCDM_00968 [Trypanosoma cruzi Dm28c]|uniref:Uncharacterized protein n=2 Tax=Trypanosoma cruzi TaxID=5693 RepID=V5BA94_TRYCR|nr:hypothetical protein TCDM_00968 [Trypanosoma cruzi Dm28c]
MGIFIYLLPHCSFIFSLSLSLSAIVCVIVLYLFVALLSPFLCVCGYVLFGLVFIAPCSLCSSPTKSLLKPLGGVHMQANGASLSEKTESSGNAATLTYSVAPHPFSYQTLFAIVMVSVSANQGTLGNLKSWMRRVQDYSKKGRIKWSQAAFTHCFSRQLEVRKSCVVASVSCALLSHGERHWGVLWATSHGLYFRSVVENEIFGSIFKEKSEKKRTMDKLEVNEKTWGDESLALKEVLSFKDVVSLLPSIALEVVDDGPPYVMGIPNPIVRPNTLQVFTVSPNQIYQFVHMHDLTVIPPSSSIAMGDTSEKLLLKHEYDVIRNFPSEFDAVTFCALTERLWEARLKALQIPLCRDGVAYAARH